MKKVQSPSTAPWPEWFVEETYSPLRRAEEYAQIIRTANGAAIDNRWLWSTPQQCGDWAESVRKSHAWHQRTMSWPYRIIAGAVASAVPTKELDVIAIGSGVGSTELNLVRELHAGGASLRVALIDLSPDVLLAGSRLFARALPGVPLCGILGDGYHVDRWPWLVAPGRARVWLCLGHPAHDLVDVEALHRACRPGDIIVSDILVSYDAGQEIELAHRWIDRALRRLDISNAVLGLARMRAGYPHQDWITAEIDGRQLRLARIDLRTGEQSRIDSGGRGLDTVTIVPAIRGPAAADVWIGRMR